MTLNHGHIQADDLERYAMSSLPEESTVVVEQHLLICETCRQQLLETEAYMTAIQSAARGLPRPAVASKRRWRWSFPRLIPAFAALACLLIAAVTLPLVHRELSRGVAAAPFAVNLQTMRGLLVPATGPSRRPLLLEMDLTGLAASPSYRIEIVDQAGDQVWQGAFNSLGATGSIAIPGQKRGAYFVRVALPSGETLREYGLQLRGAD